MVLPLGAFASYNGMVLVNTLVNKTQCAND